MVDVTPERWLTVARGGGVYDVSSLGYVRSLSHMTNGRGWREGRVLKPSATPSGYSQVQLSVDGRVEHAYVHDLVAEAFIGPKPEGQEVRHGPGGKSDNSAANLSYGTHKQNIDDMIEHGTRTSGDRHHLAKLTDEDADVIRDARRRRVSVTDLAAQYHVSKATISRITSQQSYQDGEGERYVRPCSYPGCEQRAEPPRGRGNPPAFCSDPEHNNMSAKLARARLANASRTANCAECGEEFTVKRSDQIFCTRSNLHSTAIQFLVWSLAFSANQVPLPVQYSMITGFSLPKTVFQSGNAL